MSSIIISSWFVDDGVPVTGLTPTVRIWEVNGSDQTLIIGYPEGTGDPGTGVGTDGVMREVYDKTPQVPGGGPPPAGGSRDGFYVFEFTDTMGYDPTKNYLVRVDGGPSLPENIRYQVSNITPSEWDAQVTDHLLPGSFGELVAQTKANTDQIFLKLNDVFDLVDLVRKYNTNRTLIDVKNRKLIIYDDDCTTILRVFDLFDSTGTPSVVEVCERRPSASSDGQPTC